MNNPLPWDSTATDADDEKAAAAAAALVVRRLIVVLLLTAAALDLTRCGLVMTAARHQAPTAGLVAAGLAATGLTARTARGCQVGQRWAGWAALLIGVASAPQAAASGFRSPYTIPDTATAALGLLLAITILATAGRMARRDTTPQFQCAGPGSHAVSQRAAHHNRLLGRAADRPLGSLFRTPPPQVGGSWRALRRRALPPLAVSVDGRRRASRARRSPPVGHATRGIDPPDAVRRLTGHRRAWRRGRQRQAAASPRPGRLRQHDPTTELPERSARYSPALPESKERDRGRLARAVADWIACSGDVCLGRFHLFGCPRGDCTKKPMAADY
jgi:hypothetical protein